MFFSVIVPVYKVEEYLADCIESVLNQTFSDFELILVDDGSPDHCPAICDAYAEKDSRVQVIHKTNGGLVSARQAGIRVASGRYVFNLDSDDLIEQDILETAFEIISNTGCEIVSFARKWVRAGRTVKVSDDDLEEGLYTGEKLEKMIYPKLLSDKNMSQVACYITGKAIEREFFTPIQLRVSESISLGEDLCCVVPCYLQTKSVYISKKQAYLYTVRADSISKAFNTNQILLVENIIREICRNDTSKIPDFEEQLSRYSCFMCFAILASAAEGGYFKSLKELRHIILHSIHQEKISRAEFENITVKSRISVFLMKKKCYRTAFYFLYLCGKVKDILKRG